MAHTKFILSIDKVLDTTMREQIENDLRMYKAVGFTVTAEVLEPKLTVKIAHDDDPSNPRENDHIGVMYCEHGRYTLGDKDAADPRQINSAEIVLRLPIYMYDHSGLTVSHGAFSCQWDSGQIGMHYILKTTADKEWPGWTLEDLQNVLEGELEEYDYYLRGDAWGFVVEDENGDAVESCWGFLGDKLEYTGILDHIDSELHEQAKQAWTDRCDA